MAEKQKGASQPATSKEKKSLLDLDDLGKDFLTSWKSMSVTEDDPMDFDFSTVAKGNKKTFSFDNADMDFSLDGDFAKLSSFKVDMSDLDVSSPAKTSNKPKERSKEVSVDGKPQGKSERFIFPFDFNEFDGLSFDSKVKKGKQDKENEQDEENFSNRSISQGSGIHPNGINGAMEDDIFSKHGVSNGESTLKFDSKIGREVDFLKKEEPHKSLTDEICLSKSATSEDKVEKQRVRASPQKSIPITVQEADHESLPPENITLPELYAEETCQDVSGESVSRNLFQEEVGSLEEKEDTCIGEQNIIVNQFDSSFNSVKAQGDNSPPDMACSQSNNGDKRKLDCDSHIQIGHSDDAEPAQGDSHIEKTSITSVSSELHEKEACEKTPDSNSKLIVSPLKSRTVDDMAMPDNKRQTEVVRSRFFRRSDETTKSQPQQSSLSQIKLTTFGCSRNGSGQLHPANESRKLDPRDAQSGNKLVDLPRPRELTRGEPVQIKSQGSIKNLSINRGGLNADNAATLSTGKSGIPDKDVTAADVVSNGSGKNIKDLHVFSTRAQPSSSSEQESKYASQNCLISVDPVSSMKPIQNLTNSSVEINKVFPLKDGRKISDFTNPKNVRTTGTNCAPLESTLHKDVNSFINSDRSKGIKGSLESNVLLSADANKRTSSSLTLKRKTLEGMSPELLTLKPVKRLSQSPGESRTFRDTSDKFSDKHVCNKEKLANGNKVNVSKNYQSPILYSPQERNMKELEIFLEVENDANVKKAEACAKELEDICNMLKKKHEDAKEILVRAVVNNNKLLMLNHPMYEEKIRMIQKFADLLMSK